MISEIDLRDWEHLEETKLYNVKRNTYIKAFDEYFFFDHLDGMYSYCKDMQNNVVHLAAFTPVIPLKKK
jgi:hypothetical protein